MGQHRAQVWAKTNGICWYCGEAMNPFENFTEDHMDPRKQGGTDELENLQPCCTRCNSRKHAKTVEEYRAYLAGKGELRFWGEIQVPAPIPEVQATQRRQRPTISQFQELIQACMNISLYRERELGTLLLALIQRIELWHAGEDPDEDRGAGDFILEEFSLQTHLSLEYLMRKFLFLDQQDIIRFYDYDNDIKLYFFTLSISKIIDAGCYASMKNTAN